MLYRIECYIELVTVVISNYSTNRIHASEAIDFKVHNQWHPQWKVLSAFAAYMLQTAVKCDGNDLWRICFNLWHSVNPSYSGLCGKLKLIPDMVRYDASLGHAVNFTIVPRQEFGVNISFTHFSLHMSEARCMVERLEFTQDKRTETFCGNMAPWFRLTATSPVEVKYTLLLVIEEYMEAVRGYSQWFQVEYHSTYLPDSVPVPLLRVTFQHAHVQEFNYAVRFMDTPAQLNIEQTTPKNILQQTGSKTYNLNPFIGHKFSRLTTEMDLLIIVDYGFIAEANLRTQSCVKVDAYDSPHQQGRRLYVATWGGNTKLKSSTFPMFLKIRLCYVNVWPRGYQLLNGGLFTSQRNKAQLSTTPQSVLHFIHCYSLSYTDTTFCTERALVC